MAAPRGEIPGEDRAGRLAAGREALEWERILAKSGANVVGEVLAAAGDGFFEWSHYPEGDVFDPESRSQWYYHAHPKEERPGEHGHFHTFRREGERSIHLLAVSMDRYGRPIQLFTTNRWVTGESWAPAGEVAAHLAAFDMALARPSWPVNRWLGALLRFYRPLALELLAQRDATLEAWRRRYPHEDAFEDRRLEVVSHERIDLARDLAAAGG
ncbi:hypothetical protein SH611_12565 [Geminicoccaceae bacterium 1502E]|nr:hypothetical protein [Geminicoccaceae bacterium 1502E]